MRLPDGPVLRTGDAFEAVAALTAVDPLTADANGWWTHAMGFCYPDATQVLVLDEASLAP